MNKLIFDPIENTASLDGKILDPARSLRVINHSPDGFSWGYGGSGPAQLALAILLEVVSTEEAIDKYYDFKQAIISMIPYDGHVWELDIDIKKFVEHGKGAIGIIHPIKLS